MMKQFPLVCRSRLMVITLLYLPSLSQSLKDFGNQPTLIETDGLPLIPDGSEHTIDFSRMPSIGNGHIATVIYNDTIYMNGIYNGQLSESHRARIPAEINMRVRFRGEDKRRVYRQYKLDMKNGFWEERVTVEECRVTQRVYAHQFYTRLLVTEIFAERQGAATGNLVVYLNRSRGENSADITFTAPDIFNGGNWHSRGRTVKSEIAGGHNSILYTFWSTVPEIIHIPSHQSSIKYTYIMSIDTDEEIARESFQSGSWMADNYQGRLFNLHKESWRKKWDGGGVEISGDIYLEKLTYSSFYYILSSLPSADSHRETNDYSGMSSGGLPHGGRGEADRGHVSWDQERWIYPAVLPFYPSLAKSMLSYRINTMPAATKQAESWGYKGLLYSWKSAATGIDVTPNYAPRNHLHLNGDVSFAVRQYMAMTRDRLWMQNTTACTMVRDLAHFSYSQLKWNSDKNHYDIDDVTSADGTKGSVDNCVYTTVLTSLALHYSKYAACLCNVDVNTYAPQEWIHAAQNLHWEYNFTGNYNPEYQGYPEKVSDQIVKQSGAVMLGYPLMWGLSSSTKERNLHHYSTVIPQSASSTAWAMLTINYLEVGQEDKARESFSKSYKPYVSEPYKTWREYPNDGSTNYLSGTGAYLQALLYGYGGLRVHLEYLYMNPQLPHGVHSITFRDIDYLGTKFDVRVTASSSSSARHSLMHISVKSIGVHPLELTLMETGKSYHMNRGASIPISRGEFTIQSKAQTECPLPDDNILPNNVVSRYTPASYISNSVRTRPTNYMHQVVLCVCIIRSLIPL